MVLPNAPSDELTVLRAEVDDRDRIAHHRLTGRIFVITYCMLGRRLGADLQIG